MNEVEHKKPVGPQPLFMEATLNRMDEVSMNSSGWQHQRKKKKLKLIDEVEFEQPVGKQPGW